MNTIRASCYLSLFFLVYVLETPSTTPNPDACLDATFFFSAVRAIDSAAPPPPCRHIQRIELLYEWQGGQTQQVKNDARQTPSLAFILFYY